MSAKTEVQKITEVPETQKAVGIGQVSRQLILLAHKQGKNLSNEELAIKVHELFDAQGVEIRTSAACIAWYKNDMRKKGLLPKGAGASAKSIALDLDSIEL